MPGEEIAIGAAAGAASGAAPLSGVASGAAIGAESIGASAPAISSGLSSGAVSVFEGTSAVGEIDAAPPGVGNASGEIPAVPGEEVSSMESDIFEAVRQTGSPEAGFQFLAGDPVTGADNAPIASQEISKPEAVASLAQPEVAPLTPEQQQVQSFLGTNPEFLSAFGNILKDPMVIRLMIIALQKAMEEEQKPEEEKDELSKKAMVFLLFMSLIQLATKAVEKGAKEATR